MKVIFIAARPLIDVNNVTTKYKLYTLQRNAVKVCRARWVLAYTSIRELSCTYEWFYNNKILYPESSDLPVSVELSPVLLPVRFMAKVETEERNTLNLIDRSMR